MHVTHVCFTLQKWNKDFFNLPKQVINWYIRYFTLSIISLITEVIKLIFASKFFFTQNVALSPTQWTSQIFPQRYHTNVNTLYINLIWKIYQIPPIVLQCMWSIIYHEYGDLGLGNSKEWVLWYYFSNLNYNSWIIRLYGEIKANTIINAIICKITKMTKQYINSHKARNHLNSSPLSTYLSKSVWLDCFN